MMVPLGFFFFSSFTLLFSITLNSRRSRKKLIYSQNDGSMCVFHLFDVMAVGCIGLSKWLLAETTNIVRYREKDRSERENKNEIHGLNRIWSLLCTHTITENHKHTYAYTCNCPHRSNVHCREA